MSTAQHSRILLRLLFLCSLNVPHSCFVTVTPPNTFRCNVWRSPSCYKQSACVQSHPCNFFRASNVLESSNSLEQSAIFHEDDSLFHHDKNQVRKHLSRAYAILGVASAMAWMAVSLVALSYHPDPL